MPYGLWHTQLYPHFHQHSHDCIYEGWSNIHTSSKRVAAGNQGLLSLNFDLLHPTTFACELNFYPIIIEFVSMCIGAKNYSVLLANVGP